MTNEKLTTLRRNFTAFGKFDWDELEAMEAANGLTQGFARFREVEKEWWAVCHRPSHESTATDAAVWYAWCRYIGALSDIAEEILRVLSVPMNARALEENKAPVRPGPRMPAIMSEVHHD